MLLRKAKTATKGAGMKRRGLVVMLGALLALLLVACSSGGDAGSSGGTTGAAAAGGAGTGVEQLSENAAKITLDGANDELSASVTVKDGEAYVVVSSLSAGEAEIVRHDSLGDSNDYAYEGCSVSEEQIDAGSYSVSVKPKEATGTIYVVSYPAGQLDFENSDTDALFEQVASSVE
jgi:hypothetical protein